MEAIKENKNLNERKNTWIKAVREWFRDLAALEEGADQLNTETAIKKNKKMRGANAWLLICSIMIASLGLDLNSGAVIIGAMLISPLMAPILGVGLAVAINDREALIISLRHFLLAIIIALITSTLYFWITPLGLETPQIKARTEPNLLDGLVAIFGGLAGIISTSRKEASNAIPGVAIATALMPPLCVVGFGLANQDWQVALNSFYLFFLNSFFIALTAFIIIRFLKFEMTEPETPKEAKRTRIAIVVVSLILILPSIFILYKVYQKTQTEYRINAFIDDYINNQPSIRKSTDHSYIEGDTLNQLILEVHGRDIPQDTVDNYLDSILSSMRIKNTKLIILQETDLDISKLRSMDNRLGDLNSAVQQLESVEAERQAQKVQIENLTRKIDSLAYKEIPFKEVCQEASALFSKIDRLAFGSVQESDFDNQPQSLPVWLIKWDRKKNRYEKIRDEEKLKKFLKVRTKLDTIILVPY